MVSDMALTMSVVEGLPKQVQGPEFKKKKRKEGRRKEGRREEGRKEGSLVR
jgi:hypothetical protein